MIGKSFLGESLNFLIGKLKLSYRRIFPITGESLARVWRQVDRGAEAGELGCVRRCCFVAESSMKPCFFELFLRFYITFCVFP